MKKPAVKEKIMDLCHDHHCHCGSKGGGGDSPFYGIGLIGAAFFYLPGSSTASDWVWHIFQTITWPGFLVYDLLTYFSSR